MGLVKSIIEFINKKLSLNMKIWSYYSVFLFVVFIYFIKWPIIALDTDLWYHLNSGRYIHDHHSIPSNSFFSFISPDREWVDYFWLFQIIVYEIFLYFDYYGLIIFRAFLFISILLIILIYLFNNSEINKSFFFNLIVFMLLLIFLLPRYTVIRPHLFSYLFIVLFLLIIDHKPRLSIILPALAFLWVNIHGIYYPVMVIIILAYIFEHFTNRIVYRRDIEKKQLFCAVVLVISLITVFLTPHGMKLLNIPFIPTEYASQYIGELRKETLGQFFSFQINKMFFSNPPAFHLLLIVITAAFIRSLLIIKQVRVSHLFMFLGGIFLLTKGYRMRYEFILLSLPLVRTQAAHLFLINFKNHKSLKVIPVIGLIITLILPGIWLNDYFKNRPKYPLSPHNLPVGVASFLENISASGNIFNDPNGGGYLQWMLYPRYKIFMDMEVPFLFTDDDFFLTTNAFVDIEVFKKFVAKYDPYFLIIPIKFKNFRRIIDKFPQYTLVFFDHTEVLYVNNKYYPDLALQFEIKGIDPYELTSNSIKNLIDIENKSLIISELRRLNGIYKDCFLTNQVLAMIYNREGKHELALKYAENIIENYPESPIGYRIKGDSLTKLIMYSEAIALYKLALVRSENSGKSAIYRQMAYVYTKQKDYKAAYKVLKKAIQIFDLKVTYKELYDLGATALISGYFRDAEIALKSAYLKVPDGEIEWKEKIEKQLTILGLDGTF